jgi:hypothetical protein
VEALTQPAPRRVEDWVLQWPRCVLLLQLTILCTENSRSVSASRLLVRIEAERFRMRGSPPLVETILNEMWYAANLLVHGDRTTAAHHAREAQRKAGRIHHLVSEIRGNEVRTLGRCLRLRSTFLQQRVRELIERSNAVLSRSRAAQDRASARVMPLCGAG